MSNTQYAFLEKSKVPTQKDWQASITKLGYKLTLDPELKPLEDSGYSPCKLDGFDSGFEIYSDAARDLLSEFNLDISDRDISISFRWGGDMREGACATIAAYALAVDFGAILSFEGEGIITIESLKSEINQMLSLIK